MGLFSGPNKFLVQEALEIGISNLEKSRRVDTKKLYEEVKGALMDESSPEMQDLYKRYISLYEAGIKTSTEASATLKDEVKWKHLGDLREAVKKGGQGLTLSDIEGLNQFALAEHGRQDRFDYPQRDEATIILLKDWFHMYEILKQKSIESMKAPFKDALRTGFLSATTVPFTFRYTEGNNILELSVTFKDNKIIIGSKEHALVGEKIRVGAISMDKDKFYIPFTIDGKDATFSDPIKKEEFLDRYLQDLLDGKDIRIQEHLVHVSRTGELSPKVLLEGPTTPGIIVEDGKKDPPLDEGKRKERLRYELKVYEGYAKEQLAKFEKDISALQNALKAKQFYKGEVTGLFDMATLEAVFAFQKNIKNPKYGADGLVGTEETIPALFGITPQPSHPSPVPRTRPGPGGIPRVPRDIPAGPTGGTRSQEVIAEEALIKKLREKSEAFRSVYKAVSEKAGMIFDTPEEIGQYKKAINEALIPLQQLLTEFEGRKLSKDARELYDWVVLDIAQYFSDGYSGIKNRHYRNYDLSVDLALSIIKEDLVRLKITPPRKPNTEEVLRALASHNPKLQKKIQDDLRSGFQLGQILANPRVRSEFDAVYNTVYADYERGLQGVITKLRDNNTTFTNPSGYRALDMLIFTMGTTDNLDWKARNRDIFWQSIGMIGSTAAGVVAFAATPATGGAGAILGGALLGGVVSTAGMIATKGRAGNDRETWTELGINTITFGAGGALAKGANILMKSGTNIAKLSGIALDASGGVALGVSADYARAWEQNTNISLPETVRNNLAWALLPMLLGMKGVLRERAVTLDKNMQRAKAQAVVGDAAGAKETVKAVEEEAAELAHDVKVVVPTAPVAKNTPAPTQRATPAPKSTETPASYDIGNGYVLEARPDDKFIVLKDGNPQGSIPKTLTEIEGDFTTAHNAIIPDKVKAQIEARPTASPAPTVEPATVSARAKTDDRAAPAPKRQPKATHDAGHLTQAEAHAVSEEAAKTVNQYLAKFTDNKAVSLAWDLATKELQPGGLVKSVLFFPANIMRLPAINGRKILEQWFKKSEKGFGFTDGDGLDKIGNSLKIAATASSKPFEGKTQSMLTLATMGTVAYMTYQEIQRANPNSPVELTWGAAVKFLKNMNFIFPLEFHRWFTTKLQSETPGAEVPR